MCKGNEWRRFGARDGQTGRGFVMVQPIVVKRDLSLKARLSIYCSIFVPTLTYDHEAWVVTEWMRSWKQAVEMGFPLRVAGLSLRDSGRSSTRAAPVHWKELVEVVWAFGCLMIASLWMVFGHAWERPGIPQEELGRGMSGFPSWTSCLSDLTSDKRKTMGGCSKVAHHIILHRCF